MIWGSLRNARREGSTSYCENCIQANQPLLRNAKETLLRDAANSIFLPTDIIVLELGWQPWKVQQNSSSSHSSPKMKTLWILYPQLRSSKPHVRFTCQYTLKVNHSHMLAERNCEIVKESDWKWHGKYSLITISSKLYVPRCTQSAFLIAVCDWGNGGRMFRTLVPSSW